MAETMTPREDRPALRPGDQKAIAVKLGVSETTVSRIVNGIYPTPRSARGERTLRRVQVAVARQLRRRVDDVFPRQETAA